MDHLPVNDLPMLISAVNFLLRNEEFDNLDQICFCYGIDRGELEEKLLPASMTTFKRRVADGSQ